jgi:hypothetical protein
MDAGNPYAAPSGGVVDAATGGDAFPPVEIAVRPILERTWELFRSNPGLVAGATLIPLGVSIGSGVALGVLSALGEEIAALADVAGTLELGLQIASWIVDVWLNLGMTRVLIHVARGSPAELGMLLGEGRLMFSAIVTGAVAVVATAVGLVLLVIPAIILLLGWSVYSFALVDQRMDAIAPLRESWRLTYGYKVRLLGIDVAILALAVVGIVATCGIGLLVVYPMLLLSGAVLYTSLLQLQGPAARSDDDVDPLVD